MSNKIGFAVGDRATKTPDGQPAPVIQQQITVMPFVRKSNDLSDWRNANRAAESLIPRRTYLYDLYHEYGTTDAQIISSWEKRVEPVLSAPWEFTDRKGGVVEPIQELIDCNGFTELLKAIMAPVKVGYSMAEPTFFVNDNGQNELSIFQVPLKNMRPELGIIAKDHLSDDGINVREGIHAKSILEFGDTTDLGLMLSACMYAIRKRGNENDWNEFIEIFGRGIVDATWDGFDLKQRQELARSIKEMGGGGVIVRPAGTTVDIKNNTGNANGDLQDKFSNKMDGYITKLFLGNTETTDSSKSSGYAQSQTHQEQQDKKAEKDLNYVRRYLNSRFIPILKAAGFDTKGGTFVIKEIKKINKDAFEIHSRMRKELGIPLDDDFFYEEYGVRKPDNYQELKNEAEEPENQNPDKEDKPTDLPKKEDKKPADPKQEPGTKLTWLRRVLRLFHSAPTFAVGATIAECGDHHTKIKLSAFVADSVFEQKKDGIINRAWLAGGDQVFDPELFNYTAQALTSGFAQGLKKMPVKLVDLGFEYGVDDPAIITAHEMNLYRFAGVKTLFQAQQLNALFREVKSFQEFYDTASAMLTVHNRAWLETEYNTANASGEAAATSARLQKQVELFPFWQYKTVEDSKVRHSHMLLHDVVLPWNSPHWRYIMPPNDWNCRCFIVPRTKAEVNKQQLAESEKKVKAYLASEGFKKSAKSGWGINRANQGMVFTEDQHYTTDYLDATKKLKQLDHSTYNLNALQQIYQLKKGKEFKPEFKADQRDQAVESFFNGLKKLSAKRFAMNDFNKRPVTITRSTVISHTRNLPKYKLRHQLLAEVEDVLLNPDEVWLNSYKTGQLNNYAYIKYYQDKAITVITRLSDDLILEVETWYIIEGEELRRGLLIKN